MQEQGLLKKLTEYAASDYVPFHMPGHKRETSLGITSFPNPFSVDITEIDGFDNLHHAEGILKESMERAAEIYKTTATWYLVNGSTCGILSAICAVTAPGGKILMGRNCHKSAYHAVMLQGLEPIFVYPEEIEKEDYAGRGILGGFNPKEIERILEQDRREYQKEDRKEGQREERKNAIQAVFVTSPTYEGVVSDIQAIAEVVHRYGIPLIVDEAHGAHFPFGEEFPVSAIDCGADLVIQSLHKTLPSLTQTAVLHLKGKLVTAAQAERYLPVFQSSSPSYVFLSAIENCIFYMDREGREQMKAHADRLRRFRKETEELRFLHIMGDEICGKASVFSRDPSKIVLLAPGGDWNGAALASCLRTKYHLEAEMCCESYVILMTSFLDPEEHFTRLYEALKEIDQRLALEEVSRSGKHVRTWLSETKRVCLLSQAWKKESEEIPLEQAGGRTSSGFVTVYPPGVPMLVPGEEITSEALELIRENQQLGLTVEGIVQGRLLCMKHTDL